MAINWDDPAQRANLIEAVGPDEYNRQQAEHFRQSTIETVNGRGIRVVGSRFGRIYMVDGLGRGHSTLKGARQIARGEL